MPRSSSPKLTVLLNELKTEAMHHIILFEQHKSYWDHFYSWSWNNWHQNARGSFSMGWVASLIACSLVMLWCSKDIPVYLKLQVILLNIGFNVSTSTCKYLFECCDVKSTGYFNLHTFLLLVCSSLCPLEAVFLVAALLKKKKIRMMC